MLSPLGQLEPAEIGRYALRGRLGAGGMGTVYLGIGPDGGPAAVKVIRPELVDDPEFRERFRREVAAAGRVSGRCVARVLDADPDAAQPWMATEYVEGVSLTTAVARRHRLDGRTLATLATGLADGLVAVHAAGVVHRDLKPANILLSWDGPKIIDFGLARADDLTGYTSTGAVIGTVAWMAPEQLHGQQATAATDVFSWAMCVAFAARGRHPFEAPTAAATAMRVLSGSPDLDGVPETLRPVLAAALDHDPGRRPSAVGLVAALTGQDLAGPTDAEAATRRLLADWVVPATPPPPSAAGQPGAIGQTGPTSPFGQTSRTGQVSPTSQFGPNGSTGTTNGTNGSIDFVGPTGPTGPGAERRHRRRRGVTVVALVALLVAALATAGALRAGRGGEGAGGGLADDAAGAAFAGTASPAGGDPAAGPAGAATGGPATPTTPPIGASAAPTAPARWAGASAAPSAAGGGGATAKPPALPRATTAGKVLGAGTSTTVLGQNGAAVPTYDGPATGSLFGGRRGSLTSGSRITMYCAVYTQNVTARGSSSRLWEYTNAGWIPDVYTHTGTTKPVVPACVGTVSAPRLGSGAPRTDTGPFPVVASASGLPVRSSAGSGATAVATLRAGDLVLLSCHVRSSKVTPGPGMTTASDYWDRLSGGGWVPDSHVYSDTASSAAPAC